MIAFTANVRFTFMRLINQVITLANQTAYAKSALLGPISIRNKYTYLAPSAGKLVQQGTISFGFAHRWLRKWHELCRNKLQGIVKPNQSKRELLSMLN